MRKTWVFTGVRSTDRPPGRPSFQHHRFSAIVFNYHKERPSNRNYSGNIRYQLKTPYRNVTTHFIFGPLDYNEFRRQIGLKTLTGFDDFIDNHISMSETSRSRQMETVALIREIYGTHICDKTKTISTVQLSEDGLPLDDCFGKADGTVVDNIEDVDTIVGWLAESTRPHGFAISETQFQIFVIHKNQTPIFVTNQLARMDTNYRYPR
jgi:hypothetical protein